MSVSAGSALTLPHLSKTYEELSVESALAGYIGLKLMPVVPVGLMSAVFNRYARENLMQSVDVRRKPGATFKEIGGELTEDQYQCRESALSEPITDVDRSAFPEREHERHARDRVLVNLARAHEERVMTKVAAISVSTAVGTAWDVSSATPIGDVRARKTAFRLRTGLTIDTVVLGYEIAEALVSVNTQIINRIQGRNGSDDPLNFDADTLARAFGVRQVLIAGGIKNGNKLGQSFSGSELWNPDNVGLFHVGNGNGDLMTPHWGATFGWVNAPQSGGANIGFSQFNQPDRTRDVIVGRMFTDEKVLDADLAELLTGCKT